MHQAQKCFGKALLCPTDTGGFSNEALIPSENIFCVPTENKSYSTAASPVDPSHRALGRRTWLSWGLVHVQGCQELLSHVVLSWPSRGWQ